MTHKPVSKSRRDLMRSMVAAPAAVAVAARTQAQNGARPKVLRYAFRVAETGFDPAQVNDLYSSTVNANIFEAPLSYDFLARPSKIVLNTAEAMPEISDDFTTLTLRIRRGIYFHEDPAFKNGPRELTAQDYVYSIKRFYDPASKSPRTYVLENSKILGLSELRAAALKGAKFDYDSEVEGVRALDRYTLRIKLGAPAPRFYQYLADNSFLGATARDVVEFYGRDIMAHPVGTGPFRLIEWKRSSRIVLERNANYRPMTYASTPPADHAESRSMAQRLAGRTLPMIDRVEVHIVSENQPRVLAFQNGEHDLLDELPYDFADVLIPNGRLAPGLARRGFQMDRAPRAAVDMMMFNLEHPVVGGLAPERVALRRAISLAYRNEIETKVVRKGQSMLSQSPVGPDITGYDPEFKSDMSIYDPARAKALLDLFGYVDRDGDGWREQPDGTPLRLKMMTEPNQLSRSIDEVWKISMKAVGLRIDFKTAQWPENLKATRAGKHMMWRAGWSAAQPDGDTFLALGYGPNIGQINYARLNLPAFNDLYYRQQRLPDGPEREALFREAKRLFVAYAPYKFVGHRIETSLAQPWLIGFRRHPVMRDFWKYIDIDTSLLPHDKIA
jgi:ABC-type transport system substrate-binding protein